MNCEAGMRALLAHIATREAGINAWAWLDHAAALAQARALDDALERGALSSSVARNSAHSG